MIELQVLC